MFLAEEIGRYGSVAVAGLAKNVGKTVTLNYLLRESHKAGLHVGVTSIGVDGEKVDVVTRTGKPEITLFPGTLFATSEAHYRQRLIQAEVIDVSRAMTALGRVVTARALSAGKVLLSGPAATVPLGRLIAEMHGLGAETVLVDGALSRLSIASPAITEAMVLATGAALSPDISAIVSKTRFVCSLMELPEADGYIREKFEGVEEGVWTVDPDGNARSLGLRSALDLQHLKGEGLEGVDTLYVAGVVTDRILKLIGSMAPRGVKLVVKDFTRLFVEPVSLRVFLGKGGEIMVIRKPRLLGVTYNPWSPAGYRVDRERLGEELRRNLNVPVVYVSPEE